MSWLVRRRSDFAEAEKAEVGSAFPMPRLPWAPVTYCSLEPAGLARKDALELPGARHAAL